MTGLDRLGQAQQAKTGERRARAAGESVNRSLEPKYKFFWVKRHFVPAFAIGSVNN